MHSLAGFLTNHWMLFLNWIFLAVIVHAIFPAISFIIIGLVGKGHGFRNFILSKKARVLASILSPVVVALLIIATISSWTIILIPDKRKIKPDNRIGRIENQTGEK